VAQPRLATQKIKDVLRMHLLGGVDSCRQLARTVGCGKSAVADCLRRARVASLNDWTSVAELDEIELSRRLYPAAGSTVSRPFLFVAITIRRHLANALLTPLLVSFFGVCIRRFLCVRETGATFDNYRVFNTRLKGAPIQWLTGFRNLDRRLRSPSSRPVDISSCFFTMVRLSYRP
jgi:hypothetical protein